MRYPIVVVVAMLVSGCATEYTITIRSQPEGAYITDLATGQGLGIAPVSVNLDFNKMYPDASGCYSFDGVRAQWVSGAWRDYTDVTLCLGQENYNFSASRDTSQPGLGQDLQFAAQLAQTRAAQQEAQAASDANMAAALSMFAGAVQNYKNNELQQQYYRQQQYQPPAPVPQAKAPVHCSTQYILGQLQTVCQ